MLTLHHQCSIVPFITALIISAFIPMLHAKENTRIVILQMPTKEADGVRAELNDSTKVSKSETMDAVLKRQGIVELAGFKQANPWRGEPVTLSKTMDGIEFDGERAKELGANLRLEGGRLGPSIEHMLSSEIALPTGGKGYRQFQNLCNRTVVKPGRWQERACWGDANESLMLWQFSTVEGHEPATKTFPGKPKAFMRVEMHWFQASSSDVITLGQSKPETRDKAFQWLSGRARRWKECGFQVRQDDQAVWSAMEGKLQLHGKQVEQEEDRFSIVGGFSDAGDLVKMNWEVTVAKKEKMLNRTLSATVTPGVWEFIAIEGLSDANVVACRLTRE